VRTTTASIATLRHALPRDDVAALGWLATATHGEQRVLPIDLFMLTARSDDEGAPQLQVSLLRTRPTPFGSRGGGLLAYALLTPAGWLKLQRAPLHGMTERRMPLAALCGTGDARALRDAWMAAPDAPQRAHQFGRWIETRLHQRQRGAAAQRRVAEAAACLQRCGGALDLQALGRTLSISPRQLERDFRTWLGLLPAAYARLVRFQRAARAVIDGEPLAGAAGAHHYCDQSHLNRSFRAFSSLTPRQLAALARDPRRRLEQQALAGRVFLLDAPAHERGSAGQSPVG
jgi:AraC-like DNA-binding protein